jgi:S-adenosylmethionine hydrolase
MPIITLTTDFGTADGYVGAMKGVIARIVDKLQNGRGIQVTVLDLAHDVPRGDIAHGAWVVATATREFPEDTVHLVVVDPGVGGKRQEVIVHAGPQWYVGPDNGVFAYVAGATTKAWSIEARADASPTFHGRDVFAPAAATLVMTSHQPVGPVTELAGALPWGPRPEGEGRVVHIDTYGNLITDLPGPDAGKAVTIAGRRLAIVETYEDVPKSELLAYVGSAGTIEIAVRDGRADRVLQAQRGMRIAPASELR